MPTPPRPVDAMAYLAKTEPEEALSTEGWLRHTVGDFAGIMANLTLEGDRHKVKNFHDTMMAWVINELQDDGIDIASLRPIEK